MLHKRNLIHSFVLFIAVAFMFSCGNTQQKDEAITNSQISDDPDYSESHEKASKVQDIFYAVPSPMDMASILKKSGASYDAKLLNDVRNVSKYSSSKSQALNLGIYGANLSYASVFNQNQESIIYLSCVKKLADNLGVTKAFDDETIERIEANVDNRDSMLTIVSETYYLLDAYLKENGRDHISAMVIAAGWIEGLYISTSIASNPESSSEELLAKVADQKMSLQNLMNLVEAYNTENQLDEIYADLEAVQNAFAVIGVEKAEAAASEPGVKVIGKSKKYDVTIDAVKEIYDVVSSIRTRYIS